MALLLSSERPAVAAVNANPIQAIFAWAAEVRAKRAKRVALSSLLDFDAAMLHDLGIDRQDVIEALRQPQAGAGAVLARRRAQSSRQWLPRS
jgi:uncharacterized protein YjiS (DUF1127 family)